MRTRTRPLNAKCSNKLCLNFSFKILCQFCEDDCRENEKKKGNWPVALIVETKKNYVFYWKYFVIS